MDRDLIDFSSPLKESVNILDPSVPLPKILISIPNEPVAGVGDNSCDIVFSQVCFEYDPFDMIERKAHDVKHVVQKSGQEIEETVSKEINSSDYPFVCEPLDLSRKNNPELTAIDASNVTSALYESSKCVDSGIQDMSSNYSHNDLFCKSVKSSQTQTFNLPNRGEDIKAFAANLCEKCSEMAVTKTGKSLNFFHLWRSLSAASVYSSTGHSQIDLPVSRDKKPNKKWLNSITSKPRSLSNHDVSSDYVLMEAKNLSFVFHRKAYSECDEPMDFVYNFLDNDKCEVELVDSDSSLSADEVFTDNKDAIKLGKKSFVPVPVSKNSIVQWCMKTASPPLVPPLTGTYSSGINSKELQFRPRAITKSSVVRRGPGNMVCSHSRKEHPVAMKGLQPRKLASKLVSGANIAVRNVSGGSSGSLIKKSEDGRLKMKRKSLSLSSPNNEPAYTSTSLKAIPENSLKVNRVRQSTVTSRKLMHHSEKESRQPLRHVQVPLVSSR